MFVICTHLQNAACFPPEIAKPGPEKHKGANKIPRAALSRMSFGRKEDVASLTLSLSLGFTPDFEVRVLFVTEQQGDLGKSRLSCGPQSPRRHRRGANSGWQTPCLCTGMRSLPADSAEGSSYSPGEPGLSLCILPPYGPWQPCPPGCPGLGDSALRLADLEPFPSNSGDFMSPENTFLNRSKNVDSFPLL